MKKKVNAKAIVATAKAKTYRSKVSFTFDEEIYQKFQAACEVDDIPVSRVLEELMILFLEDREEKK